MGFDTEDSILNVALGAFEKVKELEHKIEVMGEELSKTGDEKLAHDYADLLHQMEVLDGYSIHHRTEEILQGLGFANADLQKPYKNSSGGWRMRVLLAKMILQSPDVLLLDEPTNHLDLPSIEWLEKYLMHYPGAVVVVSHDRFFLDRMVTKIVELYQLQLHFYTGNYSFYETEKAMRIDLQKKAFDNQQDYIRQQERFVERFKAKASKAAQAQRSWWRFLFNRESREQFLTEQHPDRVVWRKHWFVLLTKIAAPAILSLTSTAATVWMMGYYIAGAPLSIALQAIPVGK